MGEDIPTPQSTQTQCRGNQSGRNIIKQKKKKKLSWGDQSLHNILH